MIVNFITLKWGTKYGPEYVNRLYRSLVNTYSGKFIFHCITDNSEGFDNGIVVIELNSIMPSTKVFCVQKIYTFKNDFIKGNKVLLDLDIIILKDLYPYFKEYNFCEPRLINTYWSDPVDAMRTVQICSCLINSSFVTWKDDQLQYLYDFYIKHKIIIDMKYDSIDIFYFHNFYNILKYHPKKMIYSYSFGAEYPDDLEPKKFRDSYSIVLFNTSHGNGIELHETDDWSREYWHGN
jgi:hypothetical protein